MPSFLQETRQRIIDLNEQRQRILDSAAGQARDLTYQERGTLRQIKAELADLKVVAHRTELQEKASRERVAAQFRSEVRAES